MILRFNPGQAKLLDTLVRLKRNSVVFGVADGDGDDPSDHLTLTTSAVRVLRFETAESGRVLETCVTLRFEKDRASVLTSVNPELLRILGYAPGIQSVITSDSWPEAGQAVSLTLSDKLTPAQVKLVDDLEYLVDLHVIPVGVT